MLTFELQHIFWWTVQHASVQFLVSPLKMMHSLSLPKLWMYTFYFTCEPCWQIPHIYTVLGDSKLQFPWIIHGIEKPTEWFIKTLKVIYKGTRSTNLIWGGTYMASDWKYCLLSVCLRCSKHSMRKWFLEMGWRWEGQLWINICYKNCTKCSNFWVIDLKAFWTWSLQTL